MGDWGEAEALLRDAVACFKDADALVPANVKVLVRAPALQPPFFKKIQSLSVRCPLAHWWRHR